MELAIAGPIEIAPLLPYVGKAPEAPRGLGGTPVTHLALELIRRGRRLIVFTLDPGVAHEVTLEGPRLKICIGPYRPRHRARDAFRAERDYLRDAIRRERPGLVHAHWTYEFALGALASGARTIVTAHDAPLQVACLDPSPYRLVRTAMAFAAVKRAGPLTAVSPHVADHLSRWLLRREAVSVIPNGLPRWIFDLGPAPGRRTSAPALTFATVLNGWGILKNGAAALRAFSSLRKQSSEIRLIMFGQDHGVGENAEKWAIERNLADGVEFAGAIPHQQMLQRLAAEVDVVVHPALEEAFSMAIAEAMALGLPLIAGRDAGAVPSTVGCEENGVLTDVRSPAELSRAMRALAEQPAMRTQIGRAARASALERFSIEAVADAYEREYAAA